MIENQSVLHLSTSVVVEIHDKSIDRFGGIMGIRDQALLESAVAAPQASFGGVSLYTDLVEVAAAYLFFLCRNHPLFDGNKRTALGTCLVFLRVNGVEPMPDSQQWESLVMDIASSIIDRTETTRRLRSLVVE